MSNTKLVKRAESLGITVDGRWSDDRIKQEIDQKEAEAKLQSISGGQNAANTAPIPQAPNQPTGTDSTNGLPMARFAPLDDAPPPEIEGITPGETPRPIPATVEPDNSERTVKVILDADYWPAEGDRVKAGEALDIPLSKAKELVSAGKAHRPLTEDEG